MTFELRQFPQRTWSSAGAIDTEFSGRWFNSVSIKLSGTVTTSGNGESAQDGAYRLFGTPELNQAEEPLVRMAGTDWKMLSALLNGAMPNFIGPTIDTTTGTTYANARIPFNRIIPGMAVNASAVKAFVRGQFGAGNDYFVDDEQNFSSASLTLRANVEVRSEIPPGRFWLRPRITQATVDIGAASANQQHVIRFEQDTYCQGVMLRTYDASLDSAGEAGPRSDGLVKNLLAEVTSREGTRRILSATWGQLRNWTKQRFEIDRTEDALMAGVAVLPTRNPQNANVGGAMLFRAGDSLTITIDTSGTAEAEYTNATPASGDLLYLTLLAGVPVSGGGDSAGQVRNLPVVSAVRGTGSRRRI